MAIVARKAHVHAGAYRLLPGQILGALLRECVALGFSLQNLSKMTEWSEKDIEARLREVPLDEFGGEAAAHFQMAEFAGLSMTRARFRVEVKLFPALLDCALNRADGTSLNRRALARAAGCTEAYLRRLERLAGISANHRCRRRTQPK